MASLTSSCVTSGRNLILANDSLMRTKASSWRTVMGTVWLPPSCREGGGKGGREGMVRERKRSREAEEKIEMRKGPN